MNRQVERRFKSGPSKSSAERITVRELIRSRVYQEVKDFNVRQPHVFRGLVQPTGAEQALNGFTLRKGRQIDWKEQFERAVEAYQRKQILVIADDKQLESLDQEVVIRPDTVVSFETYALGWRIIAMASDFLSSFEKAARKLLDQLTGQTGKYTYSYEDAKKGTATQEILDADPETQVEFPSADAWTVWLRRARNLASLAMQILVT